MKHNKHKTNTTSALRRFIKKCRQCPFIEKIFLGQASHCKHRARVGTLVLLKQDEHGVSYRFYDQRGIRVLFLLSKQPDGVIAFLQKETWQDRRANTALSSM